MRQPATIAAFFLTIALVAPTIAFAQTTASTAAQTGPTVVEVPTVDAASASSTLADANTAYRQSLEVYRNDERLFQIAHDQFFQLQTLTSLEQAVQGTRTAMLSRIDVLQKYFRVLQLTLTITPGLTPDVKNRQLDAIDQLFSSLATHQQHVLVALDRPSIAAMVSEYAPLEKTAEQVGQDTVLLIEYGRIQAVYDETVSVRDEIQADIEKNEKDAVVLAARHRALDEIQRNFDDVSAQLSKIKTSLVATDPNDKLSKDSVNEKLNLIYSGVSQAQSHLQELLNQ